MTERGTRRILEAREDGMLKATWHHLSDGQNAAHIFTEHSRFLTRSCLQGPKRDYQVCI